MNADEVKAAIDGMETTARDQWYPVFKSILVLLTKRLDTLEEAHGKTLKGAKGLAHRVKALDEFFNALRAKITQTTAPPAEQPSEAAPASAPNGAEPDQSVVEAQMDAAIAGEPAVAPVAAPQPAPKARRAPPPLRTVPQKMPPTSPGGDPMTAEQAAIEAQMDAAINAETSG